MKWLFVVALALTPLSASAQDISGTGRAKDGDSLGMAGIAVRLHGVDAPELYQTCSRQGQSWACGKEAMAKLGQLVNGAELRCEQRDVDDYDRIVASCTARQIDLGQAMVEAGLAVALPQFSDRYLGAEARVRRATAQIVRLVEKKADESPVALGLDAHRLGGYLGASAGLTLEGWGQLAANRQEIVQLFTQTRQSFAVISFAQPVIATDGPRPGEVRARVSARYRLADASGEAVEGRGRAELRWVKGPNGWRIEQATLWTSDPEFGGQP